MTIDYIKLAIKEARKGVKRGHGGPFGCVVVKNNRVIAKAHNRVLKKQDATCHGEIEAIRKAAKKLKTYDLSGCEIYTTGEPCLMCLGACLWSNIDKVYFGCTIEDNALVGFRDKKFDDQLVNRQKLVGNYLVQTGREECLELFKEYNGLGAQKY